MKSHSFFVKLISAFIFAFILVIILIGSIIFFSELGTYEPHFDLCVQEYKNCVYANTLLYGELNNMSFNESFILDSIDLANVRQQFVDVVSGDIEFAEEDFE